MEAERSDVEASMEPRLRISSSHEVLQHLEKRVEREVNVPEEVLQNVSREALGRLDSSLTADRGRTRGRPREDVPDHVKMTDVLSAEYDSSLARVSRRLSDQSPKTLEILKKRRDSVKAYGLYNRLRTQEGLQPEQLRLLSPTDSLESTSTRPRRLPRKESLSILNPESTDLTLLFPYLQEENGVWTLSVSNRSGEVVRTFSGSGRPPQQINWDWTDDQKEPLDQGVYTCQFEWESSSGTYQSNTQKISVQKTLRKITIEVMSSPEALNKPADALEYRIKK
jgi:hypothetical protein